MDERVIRMRVPSGWDALTAEEVGRVLRVLAKYEADEARVRCMMALLGFKVGKTWGGKNTFYHALPDGGMAVVDIEEASTALDALEWVCKLWERPVRLPAIGGVAPVDAELHGVPFGQWLRIENYYQGYLQSRNEEALRQIVYLLWPGVEEAGVVPTDGECLGALMWVECMKRVFAGHFSAFLRPVEGDGEEDVPDMLGVMNAQIRALTGGDVCKEEQVLAIDVWRALTELNEKAKEAKAMERGLVGSV